MTGPFRSIGQLVRQVAPWLVPHRVYTAIQGHPWFRARLTVEPDLEGLLALTRKNARLRGRHAGERCFIIGNGPSVLKQDLRLLEGESSISVSSGYHHPDFQRFRPRYHCLPQLTYGKVTEADAVAWFREMHERLGDAEVVLNYTEEPLVRRFGLLPGRTVWYLGMLEEMDQLRERDVPDLVSPIPRVQSVPVLCLMFAMYLGFREIFLLGFEHDHFKSGVYRYFYEPTVLHGKDKDVQPDGKVLTSRHDDFHGLARLWRQYRVMREIGERNGIGIFNATAGGELDEFPRVQFESIFEGKLVPR